MAVVAPLIDGYTKEKIVEVPIEVPVDTLEGTYVGWSWKEKDEGKTIDEASQKIQTILKMDEDGIIEEADVLFFKLSQGSWYTRQDGTARISVDLNKTPTAANPGTDYAKGTSMFTIDTHDMMSMYAVSVASDGTTGLMIVEPTTRYQYEIKIPAGYDYSTLMGDIPVDGTIGGFMPTVRTSGSGLIKPESWAELADRSILDISYYDHVMIDAGPFEGLSESSTMHEFMSAIGVTFTDNTPDELELEFGRHSKGGWQGNYEAIGNYLVGQNVNDLISLVDWTTERWASAINENNFFGIDYDASAGATKTAQNSTDGIAGATVRMSRESTSYQRALVDAEILKEDDVIKGRF